MNKPKRAFTREMKLAAYCLNIDVDEETIEDLSDNKYAVLVKFVQNTPMHLIEKMAKKKADNEFDDRLKKAPY